MQGDIQVWRGGQVESAHDVVICVARDDGSIVFEWGDVAQKIYPRSSVKIVQALPLIESGAADNFKLEEKMLALACASHLGEPEHVAAVEDMLSRAGLSEADLECGCQWPSRSSAARDLVKDGKTPSQLHNNCSGKHAGFLLACKQLGYETKGYVEYNHPIQRDIRQIFAELTGYNLTRADAGTDGCSIPNYATPVNTLARLFAALGTGKGIPDSRYQALERLRIANANYPFYMAGTGCFCTKSMQTLGERLYVKTGAQGVFTAIFPEHGLGVTLKCLDGDSQASETMMANLVLQYLPLSESEKRELKSFYAPVIKNHNKIETGEITLSPALQSALQTKKAA